MDIKNAVTSALNGIAGNMASSELKPDSRKPDVGGAAKKAMGVLGDLASLTPSGRAVADAAKLGGEIAKTFKSSSSPQGGNNPTDKMAGKEADATSKMQSQMEDNMRQQLALGQTNAKMAVVQAQITVMTQNAANLKAAAKSAQQ